MNYGFTVASTILPNVLQEALVDVWTLEDCEEKYGEDTINDDGHICVGEENQSGGCFVSVSMLGTISIIRPSTNLWSVQFGAPFGILQKATGGSRFFLIYHELHWVYIFTP